jgi:hypothetical protein
MATASNSTHYLSSLNIDSTESLSKTNTAAHSDLQSDKKLNVPLQSRSSSMHHVSASNFNSTTTTTSESTGGVAATLRPLFYSKLKKSSSQLFGVKLEKICGPYSVTNNQLPSQLIVKNEKI